MGISLDRKASQMLQLAPGIWAGEPFHTKFVVAGSTNRNRPRAPGDSSSIRGCQCCTDPLANQEPSGDCILTCRFFNAVAVTEFQSHHHDP
jgi:hypothetical protein